MIMKANKMIKAGLKNDFLKLVFMLPILATSISCLQAQQQLDLAAFTAFQSPSENWQLAGDANADFNQSNAMILNQGTGILVNRGKIGTQVQDLLFNETHGDIDLELDYMMAKNSKSGIYLQGRYEIKLSDSWSVINAKASDNGGIGERWDEEKREGYEGYAPRQNASKAPGLWQHIKISFQAPRFNASGEKTENARVLRVTLNGVVIHDNVELSGPTKGALENNEVAVGYMKFVGDIGPIAFRNIRLTHFNKIKPEIVDVKYAVYKGKFLMEPDYKKVRPFAQGTTTILSSNVSNLENEFLIRYTGNISIKQSGAYQFSLTTSGGSGSLTINNQLVLEAKEGRKKGEIVLPVGNFPFQLVYEKSIDYAKPALTLTVAGTGLREYAISDANVPSGSPVDPILVGAPINTVLRSFIDLDSGRVTHAVNVGSPKQLHYTYDMDNGMIVQVWRGGFLDATPMWHSRGDGSSRAVGSVIRFGKPVMALQVLNSAQANWSADTVGMAYVPKGYKLDADDLPTFRYRIYNATVNDASRIMDNNKGFHREISIDNPVANLYMLLAEADRIEMISANLFLIDGKSYYLRIDDSETKPFIRDINGRKELVVLVQKKISYSILF
jgi:hypothetical protein